MAMRVLVADDDANVRELFGLVLRPPSFRVVGEAADGAQAAALYRQLRPDVVLLDLAMPGVDGFDALRMIMDYDPRAAIVVCTAVTSDWAAEEALACGARAFVRRPFHITELRAALVESMRPVPLPEPVPARVVPEPAFV